MKLKLLCIFFIAMIGCLAAGEDYAYRLTAEIQTAGPQSLKPITWQQGSTPLLQVEPQSRGQPIAADSNTVVRMVIGASAIATNFAAVTNYTCSGNYYLLQWPTIGTNSVGTNGTAQAWWFTIYFEQAGHRYWTGNGDLYIEATTSTASNGLVWQDFTENSVSWENVLGNIENNTSVTAYIETQIAALDATGVKAASNALRISVTEAQTSADWASNRANTAYAFAVGNTGQVYQVRVDYDATSNDFRNAYWWSIAGSNRAASANSNAEARLLKSETNTSAWATNHATKLQGIRADLAYSNSFSRYVDRGDGTILDSETGLIWDKKADHGQGLDWTNALLYVAGLNATNYKGHNDWRLPSIQRLDGITGTFGLPELDTVGNADGVTTNNFIFPRTRFSNSGLATQGAFFTWTSVTVVGDLASAWNVYIESHGSIEYFEVSAFGKDDGVHDSYPMYIWPVRAGLPITRAERMAGGNLDLNGHGATNGFFSGDAFGLTGLVHVIDWSLYPPWDATNSRGKALLHDGGTLEWLQVRATGSTGLLTVVTVPFGYVGAACTTNYALVPVGLTSSFWTNWLVSTVTTGACVRVQIDGYGAGCNDLEVHIGYRR
jgi:hypothetical protein